VRGKVKGTRKKREEAFPKAKGGMAGKKKDNLPCQMEYEGTH
jgi:hypothetical protein